MSSEEKIIIEYSKKWVDYLELPSEKDIFYRFALLWFSFNSYYSWKYQDTNGEKKQILKFANDCKDLYANLESVANGKILRDFRDTNFDDEERAFVRDMRPNSQNRVFFDERRKSCRDFFKVVYQIRCNLFHGSKGPDSMDDKKIVEWAYVYFKTIWNKYLDHEIN